MENGEVAEISAADCEDVSLTQVLKRVGNIVAVVNREKRERRHNDSSRTDESAQ